MASSIEKAFEEGADHMAAIVNTFMLHMRAAGVNHFTGDHIRRLKQIVEANDLANEDGQGRKATPFDKAMREAAQMQSVGGRPVVPSGQSAPQGQSAA